MKVSLIILLLLVLCDCSCSQESDFGPGYKWSLFKNTPNWELAKAVAEEDTSAIYSLAKKQNLNLQEPEFGRTLLMLAVGNDKSNSVRALLNLGADVHLRDNTDAAPIHEAVSFISLKKHSYSILKQLIDYGADVNAYSEDGQVSVPLEAAVNDTACAKLLIRHGADLYFRNSDSCYTVWRNLADHQNDAIYLARELIIEKKMNVPEPILYTYPDLETKGL